MTDTTTGETPVDPLASDDQADAVLDDRPERVEPDEQLVDNDESLQVGDMVQHEDGRIGVVLAKHEDPGEQIGPDGRPLDPQPDPPVMVGFFQADETWVPSAPFSKYNAPTGREEGDNS